MLPHLAMDSDLTDIYLTICLRDYHMKEKRLLTNCHSRPLFWGGNRILDADRKT